MLTVEPGPDVAPYHNRQIAVIDRARLAALARRQRARRRAAQAEPGGDVRGQRAPRAAAPARAARLLALRPSLRFDKVRPSRRMPLAERQQGAEQGAADLEELLAAGDGAVEALGAGEDLEVADT